MEFNKSIFFTIAKYLLIIFLFGITACQSGLFSYRGRIIEPERHLTLLTNGPHKGLWETFDLTLEYQYEQKAGQLHVSGAAQLSYHYQTNYELLDHFYLMVFFLDLEGKVLESQLVLNAILPDLDETFSFKKSLEIPPGAVSITFHDEIGVREMQRNRRGRRIIP